ncbi:hypothetical protein SAMN05216188_10290 [Lentzea xinjiangensis]|uniref:Uncharacterized protein n=1 Tax=Lentzea xinjiangensis TaxID=402600 RepID=A0A1H9DBF6_9PSEU|nr:hypothetical protein SAMN05216188_10290 [Lentzea xinjiangensis]
MQWVRVEWAQRAKGGAGVPDPLPEGFVLPHLRPAVHEVVLREENGFRPVWSAERAEIDRMRLSLREDDGVTTVQLHDTMMASPRRRERASPVRLLPGQWVRWQLDHRWERPRDGGFNHLSTTLNLACAPVTDPELFLGAPTRHVDERVRPR